MDFNEAPLKWGRGKDENAGRGTGTVAPVHCLLMGGSPLDDLRISASGPADGDGTPPARGIQPGRGRGIIFQIAAVLLTVVSALAGTGLARWLRCPAIDEKIGEPAVKFPNRLFAKWGKPDFVLILSGQQHGYMLPCGCSHPQVGGLERRYNFLQMIKAAGWPHVAFDLGDVPQRHGPAGLPNQQGMIKYLYSMTALKTMDYNAVSFGEYEVNLGLSNVLDEWALNNDKPRIVMNNLMDAEIHFPTQTATWQEANVAGVKIGITAVIGPTVAAKIKVFAGADKKVRFEKTPNAINAVWKDMKGKVDIPILLFQGPVTRNARQRPPTEAIACAEAYPQFPIVVCLCDEDEPPALPEEVKHPTGKKTLVITLGHKGKFIGAVGVFKTSNPGDPYRFDYQRAEMTEDFLTKSADEKGHPIIELMEAYTKKLRDENYLVKYGQVRHQLQVLPPVAGLFKPGTVEYVGSDACKKCHEHAYQVWKNSPHSHAYKTLVNANRPSNRQYDPECIVCHTVGFGINTGYVNETKTPKLKDVGCESCHGPASRHVANTRNKEWHKRINPWKYQPANVRKVAIDQMCQKCHDIDNDVTWIHGGFEKKWGPKKIEHYTPKEKNE
jgi:hypothetical protein